MSWQDLLPQIVAIGAGGLLGSMGPVWLFRRSAVLNRIAAMKGWMVALSSLLLVVPGAIVIWRFVVAIQAGMQDQELGFEVSAPIAFGAALAVGLPFAAPHLVVLWLEQRRAEKKARKAHKATRQERLEYIAKLKEDLGRYGDGAEVVLSLEGEKGTVLRVDGDLDRTRGERFTAALRGDLLELGFKRVEGGKGTGKWWSKV